MVQCLVIRCIVSLSLTLRYLYFSSFKIPVAKGSDNLWVHNLQIKKRGKLP